FNGTDGGGNAGSLTLLKGILYGMTEAGGANSDGNIFSIDTNGSGFKDLLDFSGVNGEIPFGSLTISGNNLYGMTAHGGTKDSGVIFSLNYTTVGINELNQKSSTMTIFPNPSDGIFNFELAGVIGQSSVEIYNMLGEEIYSQALRQAQGDNTIDLSNQPSGIYLYRITSEKGEYIGSGKLVIQ
ncbi:MAG TPA: choice-of-anchor tandem repeat GloVer-containing protein, partial [Bacteroidia bacterium]|nr:choice-of-anchor tandem repeat GloVer-containing protein [Bacteroidia bacterium]